MAKELSTKQYQNYIAVLCEKVCEKYPCHVSVWTTGCHITFKAYELDINRVDKKTGNPVVISCNEVDNSTEELMLFFEGNEKPLMYHSSEQTFMRIPTSTGSVEFVIPKEILSEFY